MSDNNAPEDQHDIDPENPDAIPGVRDITLPDGTVRHNVGSDNLSDEDREPTNLQTVFAEAAIGEALNEVSFDAGTDEFIASMVNALPPEQRDAMKKRMEAQFQESVARSRQQHIDFVTKHNKSQWEVKFADAMGDQTYFVSFLINNPRRTHVVIPPIHMNGKPETVKPGRLYACNGYEARLMERVLASKGFEILNITPKRDGIPFLVNGICADWRRYYPSVEVKPKRNPFGNYVENTVEGNPQGPNLNPTAAEGTILS